MIDCIIIEDEQHAASYLTYLLQKCNYEINILAVIDTVYDATIWLKRHEVDLIFLDIQLGDGNSFRIFDQVKIETPIIFTTSHHDYAIQAFNVNAVSYLLKPIELEDLNAALDKFDHVFNTKKIKDLSQQDDYQNRFMISLPNSLRVIEIEDIAYFMVQNRHTFIVLNNNESLLYDSPLDAIEIKLNPKFFYRINRQFIVRKGAIDKMLTETRGRVKLEMINKGKEEMIVSIDRAVGFKEWLL